MSQSWPINISLVLDPKSNVSVSISRKVERSLSRTGSDMTHLRKCLIYILGVCIKMSVLYILFDRNSALRCHSNGILYK